ncbi:hypothetical protein [Gluconobacter morbifer]|nr:hypothetical protein [Gluconobacter morbifer]
MTVDQAFKDTARGFRDFNAILKSPTYTKEDGISSPPMKLGLIACRLKIHFNISSTSDASAGGHATLSAPIEAAKIEAGEQFSNSSNATIGNTIDIDMASNSPLICERYNGLAPEAAQKGDATTATAKEVTKNVSSPNEPLVTPGTTIMKLPICSDKIVTNCLEIQ